MSKLTQLIPEAQEQAVKMMQAVERGNYGLLPQYKQKLAAINAEMQQVNVQELQHFTLELARLNEALQALQALMEDKRDAIRQELDGLGQSGHAAKAYTKSSFTKPDNDG